MTLLVAYQLLFRQDLSDFQQEISAACAALGEGSRHTSWSLAILDMEIGGDEVGAFLAACEDGAPLSVALREALGLDAHFGGALILDEDQMGLAFDVDNVLYVPYEIETLGESLAELQAAAIKDIFSYRLLPGGGPLMVVEGRERSTTWLPIIDTTPICAGSKPRCPFLIAGGRL